MNSSGNNKAITGLGGLHWIHADVFSNRPLAGNGLTIFPESDHLTTEQMQLITQEMRQFESIFLFGDPKEGNVQARIFTMEEELDFAGHPILGAAAALQYRKGLSEETRWNFSLNKGEVAVKTEQRPHGFWAEMDQGIASFEPEPPTEAVEAVLAGLGLTAHHLPERLPVTTVSTGLPYVIVPVTAEGLAAARIQCDDFEHRLSFLGGKFAYLIDPEAREGRTWDNLGLVEDVATGSAAGPAAAYLWRYCNAPERLVLSQGRFIGRPSEIFVNREPITGSVLVSGDVVLLAQGQFF